jgi:N-methylhydantoinase A
MRQVYFGEDWIDTPIYDRASLEGGMTGTGPMVIQEFGSTTVVFPGQSVSVDGYQILIIGRAP